MRKKFIAGNWKMYKTVDEAKMYAEEFKNNQIKSDVEVAICAPYTHLKTLIEAFEGTDVKIGAQNMHYEEEGAFTGEISGRMLKDMGVDYCIIGHSERRQYFNETDDKINKKLHTALKNQIKPILCVGEVLSERDDGRALDVVTKQLKNALIGIGDDQILELTIAYEPVWAIGTGRTAGPEQANEMCGHIRTVIKNMYGENNADRIVIQYGGSVKPENATELLNMDQIDGALVGGASLDPISFAEIINF